MQSTEDREAVLARAVRRKLRHAAREIVFGKGTTTDRLVAAWVHLRPLFPKAVPGQAGLTAEQRRELEWILDSMGGWRGAGANAPVIRRIPPPDAEKVATRIRWLASAVPADPDPGESPGGGAPSATG